ncbi:hypothetical protein BIV57_08975 [Mangrovactinospora gilvigrisea]|uniref:Hyaluronidase n=1 Tax=Mangrovactinospora gilvigrisea TaxID=1428644 RepID=A0A1J7BW59_9ACTN|nr:beta-N-acetylglucosaminidase domain-containing protein [Mangrovactinospora gilvigrisea]OIV37705.1 hypothetical protein BIV57_08975 [Mangrovactinospora gilvigrisea]
MPHERRNVRTVLAASVALLGGAVGAAPSAVADAPPAVAAPDVASTSAGSLDVAALPDAAEGVPAVFPAPREVRGGRKATVLPRTVDVVAGGGADASAVRAVRATLTAAGAQLVDGDAALTVYVDGARARAELARLGGRAPDGLPSGGYALAVGARSAALVGRDAAGTFYAAQTLRQLLVDAKGRPALAAATVRDWPAAPQRGLVEGFYGAEWSTEQRLAQLDFLGSAKQNTYLYAPGDDNYRQADWRSPYPAQQAEGFRRLAARAADNHVRLQWALSPGQNLCYSSHTDRDALFGKLDAMWDLGFRGFQLQFQDVSYTEWHCSGDSSRYGQGPQAAARAQADVANELAQRLHEAHPDAPDPLLTVLPTEYYQDGASPYRTELGRDLDAAVGVGWTGGSAVPRTITAGEAGRTASVYRRPLLTMDNYPVNDDAPDRLYLGPSVGRAAEVANTGAGVLSNAMLQPAASRIALSTAGDFAWNPDGYDPSRSWSHALTALAGGAAPGAAARAAALRVLAGNESSSPLDDRESGYLAPLLREFWSTVEPRVPSPRSGGGRHRAEPSATYADAARRLRAAFTAMRTAPAQLRGTAVASEAAPWLAQLARYGEAGENAVDMLSAQRAGNGAAAWRHEVRLRVLLTAVRMGRQEVGDGVLTPFLRQALATGDAWAGRSPGVSAVPESSVPAADGHEAGDMADGSSDTFYRSERPPEEGDWFGVDLGSAQPVGTVRVSMGGGGENLRRAVLEYSSADRPGAAGWHRAGVFAGSRTITARLPGGARARWVRLRALDGQDTAVVVDEFAVAAPDQAGRTVRGGPPAVAGSPVSRVIDGDPQSAYRAADAPAVSKGAREAPPRKGGGGRRVGGSQDLVVGLGGFRRLDKVTVLTDPGSGTRARVAVRQRDGRWRQLGTLAAGGWSELPASGREADAIRLEWLPGSGRPVVDEIVPWFTADPAVALRLPSGAVDVEAGGAAARVTADAESAGGRAADTQLTVAAPKGLAVQAPSAIPVPRGRTVAVPLRVSAARGLKPGTYRVPVAFTVAGRTVRQTLDVRVFPRTDGRDLARGAAARASGEESAAFPASALTDGDAATRWSSPQGGDAAWAQVELARPAEVGRVVLHWEDAFAARYRVEVSADGRSWRNAAAVDDGAGGVEAVRMDERGVRFVRIRMAERGTGYGYSLWSLSVYGVARGNG